MPFASIVQTPVRGNRGISPHRRRGRLYYPWLESLESRNLPSFVAPLSFDTGTQFAGNPMTYSVNGKQYIALTLGGRPGRDEGSFPEAMTLGQNVMVVVFGL